MGSSANADLLQQALTLHRSGSLAEAAAGYAAVLRADPGNADAHYYLGMMSCQRGRFTEGMEYAQESLVRDPRHARAHVLLGRALSALGRQQDALASLERAIALAPDLPQAHSHCADVLGELGRQREAIEAYDRALILAPERAEDWFNRGLALDALGRVDEALTSIDRAILHRPESAEAHLLRAKLLANLRRCDEALDSADRAIALERGLAPAWLGRGNIAASLRRWTDALAAYDQAVAIKPDFAEAWSGRCTVYLALGKPDLAVQAAIRLLEINETAHAKALFVQSLGYLKITVDDRRLHRMVRRALSELWVRPHALMGSCISLLKLNRIVAESIAQANSAWATRREAANIIGPSRIAALAESQLLCRTLEAAPLTDIGLERLLASVRYGMLVASLADDFTNDRVLEFYCSVARQCFINEYVLSVSEAEAEQVRRLRNALEDALARGRACPVAWLVAAAAYFPLHSLTKSEALLKRFWPQCVKRLVEQQIEEPAEERRLIAGIGALTPIDRAVSREVRGQYEENPYPRWTGAGPPALPPTLSERGPQQVADILIAGCGTGMQTIEIARALDARILAVDVSLASLGYAKRMAQQLGLNNIEFAQADLLELEAIDRRFDFIEASGVLHHLADPWQGWRVLLSLLRPGGAMQVGLYSAAARRNVAAIRELIAHRGYRPTIEDIRRCRDEIMATEQGSLLKSVTTWSDFHATSDCRDMLFHVQEWRMTLPEIKSFLQAERLQFTGFILPWPVLNQFALRFPEPAAATDLDRWATFELRFPETFAGMYQFGIRKPEADPSETPAASATAAHVGLNR